MKDFCKSKNFALAIIGLALLVIMAGMFGFMYHELNNANQNTTTVEVNFDDMNATEATTPDDNDNTDDAVEAQNKSILLVDASGSMPEVDETKYMKQYHYDELKYFGDIVADDEADCKNETRIGTALHQMLEEGYTRIGILTDLETYPAGDLQNLVGEYDEREVRFIYTDNYKQVNLDKVNKAVTGILDPDTCTFIFVDENGEEQEVIRNYVEEPETEPVAEPVVANPGNVKVVTTGAAGNNAMFIMMMLMMFALATFAIIALIACNNNAHPEPAPAPEAKPVPAPASAPVVHVQTSCGCGCKCCKKHCNCCCCGTCKKDGKPQEEGKKPEEPAEPAAIIEKGVKEEIPAQLADSKYALVLDYSYSVNPDPSKDPSAPYLRMLEMAKELYEKANNGQEPVFYCFGDKAMLCNYEEAKMLKGSAHTDIDPVLKMLEADGKKDIIILTDGKINRGYAKNYSFDSVVIYEVNGGDRHFAENLAKMAKNCKTIAF